MTTDNDEAAILSASNQRTFDVLQKESTLVAERFREMALAIQNNEIGSWTAYAFSRENLAADNYRDAFNPPAASPLPLWDRIPPPKRYLYPPDPLPWWWPKEELSAHPSTRKTQKAAERGPIKKTKSPSSVYLSKKFKDRAVEIYILHLSGVTLADIGRQHNMTAANISWIVKKERRRQLQLRRHFPLSEISTRPIDMGGPRDVWLTFFQTTDPRLDFMEPVTQNDS